MIILKKGCYAISVITLLTLFMPLSTASACRGTKELCNKGLCTIECCSKRMGVDCYKVNDGWMCHCQAPKNP